MLKNIDVHNLKIRAATERDWQRVIDIYNQAVLEKGKTADTELQSINGRKEWLIQHLDEKHPILLAENDTQIIGWCSLSPHRTGRKALDRTAEISYYVDKDFRNSGVGSFLIEWTISFAKRNDIKNLFALLLDINKSSVNILEKFGFNRWGHLPNVAVINDEVCGQYIYGIHI